MKKTVCILISLFIFLQSSLVLAVESIEINDSLSVTSLLVDKCSKSGIGVGTDGLFIKFGQKLFFYQPKFADSHNFLHGVQVDKIINVMPTIYSNSGDLITVIVRIDYSMSSKQVLTEARELVINSAGLLKSERTLISVLSK